MISFDHRASILTYLEYLATRNELVGSRETATDFRAAASSIAAGVDMEAGEQGLASPVVAVAREVSQATPGVSVTEIMGPSRLLAAVHARYAVVWIVHKRLGWSLDRIAKALGRETESTRHMLPGAEKLRDEDPAYREMLDRLTVEDIRCPHCTLSLIPA